MSQSDRPLWGGGDLHRDERHPPEPSAVVLAAAVVATGTPGADADRRTAAKTRVREHRAAIGRGEPSPHVPPLMD